MRPLSEPSRRILFEQTASNAGEDMGALTRGDIDDHVADTTIHRGRFDRSVRFESPSSSRAMLFYTERALTLHEIVAVGRGRTPSGKVLVKWAVDLGGVIVSAVNPGTVITDEATGQHIVAFDSNDIPAGAWVWVQTSNESGTIDELAVTLILSEA
jgi:hypothetical protein